MATTRVLVLLFFALGGLYVGISGLLGCTALQDTASDRPYAGSSVIYRDISFQNEQELRAFLKEESDADLSPWLYDTPQSLWPLITALGFGLLGGSARVLKSCVLDQVNLPKLPVFSAPPFGALMGILLFYLAYLIPAILVVGESRVRAGSLAAIALFGGLFSETTFNWIEKQFKDILSKLGKK